MICDPLAETGTGAYLTVGIVIAVVCMLIGGALFVATRAKGRRSGLTATLVLAVLVGATIIAVPTAPAEAAATECRSAGHSLVVTQTSVMDGLAPGVPPRPISGVVENRGNETTYITSVRVEITSIGRSPQAPVGTCAADDYVIADALMPVERSVGPGGVVSFLGASIGFANGSTNQDACKGATIHLTYTANPQEPPTATAQ